MAGAKDKRVEERVNFLVFVFNKDIYVSLNDNSIWQTKYVLDKYQMAEEIEELEEGCNFE